MDTIAHSRMYLSQIYSIWIMHAFALANYNYSYSYNYIYNYIYNYRYNYNHCLL